MRSALVRLKSTLRQTSRACRLSRFPARIHQRWIACWLATDRDAPWEEGAILGIARLYEQAHDWQVDHPPLS